MSRIEIYDTTLRDGSQGEGVNFSLQDKLLITARLDELGFDFIEGGYPLSNPKDAEYFQRVRDLQLTHARSLRLRHDPPRGTAPDQDPGMQALLDSGAGVITIVGKTWDFHVTRSASGHARRKPGDDRRQRPLPVLAGSRGDLRRRAFLRRLEANPEYALRTIRAAAEAGARIVVLCDTNGGSLPEEVAGHDARRRSPAWAAPVGIHCTTTASWPWPTRWPRSTPAPCRCRARSTASASAAATPT